MTGNTVLDTLIAVLAVISGFTLSVLASRRAVDHTADIAAGLLDGFNRHDGSVHTVGIEQVLPVRTDLGRTPYPEYTREFLYAVPSILFGVPAFLLALSALTEQGETGAQELDAESEGGAG